MSTFNVVLYFNNGSLQECIKVYKINEIPLKIYQYRKTNSQMNYMKHFLRYNFPLLLVKYFSI